VIRRLLVANRGEIAVRVIRAARELGITTVAVYSEADAGSMPVRMADEAVPIGPAPARQSYLSLPAILNAATQARVDALHPGYGFLSENPHLPSLCELWGITFVGPSAEAIRRMGDKAAARETARAAGAPVIPGSDGVVRSAAEARAVAERVGLPLMVKASAGGGGRGIRVVRRMEELDEAIERATREAEAAFGQGDLYIERLLERPRHVEIQVLADGGGRCAALGERESSLQRRRQKLLEEAPAVPLTPELRRRMEEAAVRVAQAVGYVGAGTVEFLLDRDGRFYFIEMNTRVQVEHPCTEWVTGIDIVKEQLRVASGEPLSFDPAAVEMRGWAIECRINAEDPDRDFRPSPGRITRFDPPAGPGVRVDQGVEAGDSVSPYYDSLLAKVIVHGRDRAEAVARMRRALAEFRVEGVTTTIPLHRRILDDPAFVAGEVDIEYLEDLVAGRVRAVHAADREASGE
jgi:acetyl-CoA carboxylase biotin carboxylase subunit